MGLHINCEEAPKRGRGPPPRGTVSLGSKPEGNAAGSWPESLSQELATKASGCRTARGPRVLLPDRGPLRRDPPPSFLKGPLKSTLSERSRLCLKKHASFFVHGGADSPPRDPRGPPALEAPREKSRDCAKKIQPRAPTPFSPLARSRAVCVLWRLRGENPQLASRDAFFLQALLLNSFPCGCVLLSVFLSTRSSLRSRRAGPQTREEALRRPPSTGEEALDKQRPAAAAAAPAPPEAPEASAEAAATTAASKSRYSIGKRRAADKRLNWHRQYIYGPVDPTAAFRRQPKAAADAAAAASMPPEALLRLQPQRRPPGLRWKLLEELEAGEAVLEAADSAAKKALEEALEAQGPRAASSGGPHRKAGAPRRSTAPPLGSLQMHMRRAALRAAAETVEQALKRLQRGNEGERGPGESSSHDLGGSSSHDLGESSSHDLGGSSSHDLGGSSSHDLGAGASASSLEPDTAQSRKLYPRAIFAAELRRLLQNWAALAAEGVLRLAVEGGAPAKGGEVSCSVQPQDPTTPGAPGLSLLAALLPREGVVLRPSCALLTCQLLSTAGFDETIEVHVHLKRTRSKDGGGKPASRGPSQRVQGFVTLPHGVMPSLQSGTSKAVGFLRGAAAAGGDEENTREVGVGRARAVRGKKRGGIWRRPRVIAALVDSSDEAAAREAGADIVGVEALVESLSDSKKRGPDTIICTPEMMAVLSAHGKTLGRRNLIPSVAMGTLTPDPVHAIRIYRQPTIQFRADRLGVVHAPIGYASMEAPHLLANFHAFLEALKAAALSAQGPKQAVGASLLKIAKCMHVCSTMGPSLQIDLRAC
ncbi:trans-splicing factor Raa3, chloroplastic [Cyclospora cayetanensis]|uniref:Trans-splicing factor Raa3, chloroplastic n=1 Tax=Cyclospora cayetanensis TaxID=88456 RepID=A0A6P6RSG7_9EIME|nr:trans-splicing factor Raa3, chloroplastic [Cyclospora cayetanensis]